MTAIAGVNDVTYDCKTATVRMRAAAMLSQADVARALETNGFRLTSFSEGAAPRTAATIMQLSGMTRERRERVEQSLRAALASTSDVVVDSAGLVTIAPSPARLTQGSVNATLASTGCTVATIEATSWPRDCALYQAEIDGIDAERWPELRAALATLDKVITAQVFSTDQTALLRLNEPCSKIEARVRAAVIAHNGTVTRFGLRTSARTQ